MKKKLLRRGAGKTAFAIKESAQNQIPIVCFNDMIARGLQQRAENEGVLIPKPISIQQLIESNNPPPKVIIDDLDNCLSHLMPNTEIVMATMTI